MATIIGVRFRDVGKIYYFDPDGYELKNGEHVIVETSRGIECGEVAMGNRQVDDNDISYPLKKLIRIATDEDMQHVAENKEKEKKAYEICCQKIAEHNLKMKLIDLYVY